jgi:predicted TIM-barrel fold metal-dependent hydrolase
MQANLVEVITMDASGKRDSWPAYSQQAASFPDQYYLTCSFDAVPIDDPEFAEKVVAQLQLDIAAGARMVKVWKEIGMGIKDGSGSYIQIDDARFQSIWDYLVESGIPVLAHIGEPRAAWLPLDERSPHYGYYRDHPEYHAFRHEEIPRWETIMAARDRWLRNNPELIVVGAHMGSMAYDVDEVAERLDAYPNFYVDTSARFGDLAQQNSETVRDFFIQYANRILYGTDLSTNGPASERNADQLNAEESFIKRRLELHRNYLAGGDSLSFRDYGTEFPARTNGLDLPILVLEKVFYANAARILGVQS